MYITSERNIFIKVFIWMFIVMNQGDKTKYWSISSFDEKFHSDVGDRYGHHIWKEQNECNSYINVYCD